MLKKIKLGKMFNRYSSIHLHDVSMSYIYITLVEHSSLIQTYPCLGSFYFVYTECQRALPSRLQQVKRDYRFVYLFLQQQYYNMDTDRSVALSIQYLRYLFEYLCHKFILVFGSYSRFSQNVIAEIQRADGVIIV